MNCKMGFWSGATRSAASPAFKMFLQLMKASDSSSLFQIFLVRRMTVSPCYWSYHVQLWDLLGHLVAASWGAEGPSNCIKQQEGRHESSLGCFSLEFDVGVMQRVKETGFLHLQIPLLLSAEDWTWDPPEQPSAPCSREALKDTACGFFYKKKRQREIAWPLLPRHPEC